MAIVIKNLSKTFSEGNVALKDVTMTFKENEITGLIGFNGSGKTTTFNILADFIEKYEGTITFDGKPISSDIKETISYLGAGAEPKNKTKASKHLLIIGLLYGATKQQTIDKIAHLAKKFHFTQFLDKKIKTLSKGNQQKIKLISSFLNPHCKYIFLDEPFDGLDPIMVNIVKKEYMALKNTTIIITSHRMDVVQEIVKEFYVLKDGMLVDARRTDTKTIVMSVNKEIPLTAIGKMKEVLGIKTFEDHNEITIDDIKSFKKINLALIKSNEFISCSLVEKNIAASVFEHYENAKGGE